MVLNLVTYNQPSAQCLVDLINQDNHQAFTLAQLNFTNPIIGNTPTDTLVTITPSSTSGLTGTVKLEYQRLDIGEYFEGAVPTLYIPTGIPNAQSVLNALLNQFQIYGAEGANDGFTVTFNSDNTLATIIPNPNSFVWVGTLVAEIDQRPLLAAEILVTALPGFVLPSGIGSTRPQAQAFYGLINGNSMINELLLYHAGDSFSEYMATWDVGTQILKEPWYANSTPGDYNLWGASVLYNGAAVGAFAVPTSAGSFNGNVLVLNLGSACLNRCGQLYIIYQPALLQQGGGAPSPVPSGTPHVIELPPQMSVNLLYN